MTDRHTFPIAQDDAGRIFIRQRLVWSEETGLLEHDLREQGCTMARGADGWWQVWIPDLIARAGDADTLKASGLRRFRLYAGTIDGRLAAEDAFDCNHCEDVELWVDDLHAARKYAGTIKGRSRRITIHATQHGPGLWDFGNFSDQGNGRTTECALDVHRPDGGLVDVRALSADVPALLNSAAQAYRVQRLNQGWFYPLFNWLKDLARQFRIKL